jgi:hypothetical protein
MVKKSVLPKFVSRVIEMPVKIPRRHFENTGKLIQILIGNAQVLRTAKTDKQELTGNNFSTSVKAHIDQGSEHWWRRDILINETEKKNQK